MKEVRENRIQSLYKKDNEEKIKEAYRKMTGVKRQMLLLI
jgi:hypothetical protein